MTTLRLGCVDAGHGPASKSAYLRIHHGPWWDSTRDGFRGEANGLWRGWKTVSGRSVHAVQGALREAGFLPHGPVDGVYGYRTRAGVRLFQEYVRAAEGVAGIGTPDGIVGPNTRRHLDRWVGAGTVAPWHRSDFEPTPTAKRARRLLESALDKLRTTERDTLVDGIDTWAGPTATMRSADWTADPDRIHLVGIRRNARRSARKRVNDDLFVLLGGGMCFVFRGSTDPNPSQSRDDEPYLVRGQHRYRFGWHKINARARRSDGWRASERVYRAFQPDVGGVLVIRDQDRNDAISAADVAGGLSANTTINIHWSGSGTSNWSAGCQVVAGRRYYGYGDAVIDCSGFASPGYVGLGRKTRGAWHVLEDAVTAATPILGPGGDRLLYTLLYEEDLHKLDGLTADEFRRLVKALG